MCVCVYPDKLTLCKSKNYIVKKCGLEIQYMSDRFNSKVLLCFSI